MQQLHSCTKAELARRMENLAVTDTVMSFDMAPRSSDSDITPSTSSRSEESTSASCSDNENDKSDHGNVVHNGEDLEQTIKRLVESNQILIQEIENKRELIYRIRARYQKARHENEHLRELTTKLKKLVKLTHRENEHLHVQRKIEKAAKIERTALEEAVIRSRAMQNVNNRASTGNSPTRQPSLLHISTKSNSETTKSLSASLLAAISKSQSRTAPVNRSILSTMR